MTNDLTHKQIPADAIAAVATANGKGGVGIIRISGPAVADVMQRMFGKRLTARQAYYSAFKNLDTQAVVDTGIAIYFAAPNSYTGEDVLELQGHGGPVVLNILLKQILTLENIRLAEPGEFTLRAFLNNKMDLTQAEAVADLINSASEQAAIAASNSLSGGFSAAVSALLAKLTYVRIYLEAALDFPDEEIDFIADKELQTRISALTEELAQIKQQVRQGRLLKEGLTLVILGQPNAGKSSLLNQLTQQASAIVTDIAGTTRDVLREHIHIDGLPLHIVDTAGLRESADIIEQEGVKRAWQEVARADRVLLLIDNQQGLTAFEEKIIAQIRQQHQHLPIDYLFNKIDINQAPAKIENQCGGEFTATKIYLSAKTGAGIDLLKKHLKESVAYQQSNESVFIARQRHTDALAAIEKHIHAAVAQFNSGFGELAAEELRLAQQQLASITGEFHSDDLLGEIFAGFCIGK